MTLSVRSSLVALMVLAMGGLTTAAPINYGDFVGTTVTYLQVTEDTVPSTAVQTPLFAAPTISGDSLDFDPVSFSAAASGAAGNDTTAANLEFDVQAIAGKFIQTLTLTESGNTSLSGFSNDAFTSVTTDIIVDIEEVDGAPVPGGPINFLVPMTFTPSGGDYQLSTDGGGNPTFNTQWSGIADIDLDAILASEGVTVVGGATLVTVSLTNTLTALSQDGTSALISKQDADGISITANIPEPTTLLLVGLASTLTLARRR